VDLNQYKTIKEKLKWLYGYTVFLKIGYGILGKMKMETSMES
jgi:hypothetical protein